MTNRFQGDVAAQDPRRRAAQRMVEEDLRPRGIHDPGVLEAMLYVPRDRFLPDVDLATAYSDRALPTAEGQTISQPFIVALMTQALAVKPGQKVLEIGAGSGYQAAILAHLGASVITMERNAGLAERARRALEPLGYGGAVQVVTGDGTLGWVEGAPYDGVLVAAAAPHVPQALREQTKPGGGRIVIPLGDREEQELTLLVRQGDAWDGQHLSGCRFVPLVGADGWPEAG